LRINEEDKRKRGRKEERMIKAYGVFDRYVRAITPIT